jgi:hypothetical protein
LLAVFFPVFVPMKTGRAWSGEASASRQAAVLSFMVFYLRSSAGISFK